METEAATSAVPAAEATASVLAVERFLDSPSLSAATRRAYRVDALEFVAWLERRGLTVEDVDVRALTEYAADLGRARPAGKLAPSTISRKLAGLLENENVKTIEVGPGTAFNPALHEAITHDADPSVLSGHVIEVVRNGYRLGERVLRPALVRVAQ